MAIFPTAFLRLNRAGKWVWRYSTTKNVFLGYKNKKFKKPKIWGFFKGVNPWFLSKKGHFSTFFLGNIGQENVFYDILEQKNDFLRYKNKKFKKSKYWHFYQGVTHGFGPKTDIFPTFFSGNIAQGNVLYDIVYRKNAFVAY